MLIAHAERPFVSEENLKAADAAPHDFAKVAFRFVVVAGHAEVKAEVAGARSLRFAQPKLESLERFLLAAGADHFDKSRRPADERRAARRLVRVLREGAHEGQVDVDVWIDEPGKDILAGSIDHLSIARRSDVAIDPGNRFAFAKDIGNITLAGGDDFAAFDQKGCMCYFFHTSPTPSPNQRVLITFCRV